MWNNATFLLLWRGFGWAITGMAAIAGRWIFTESAGPEVIGIFAQAVGIFIGGLGVCGFAMWFGYTIWRSTKSERLKGLQSRLDGAQGSLYAGFSGLMSREHVREFPLVRDITHDLDRLGIPHPGLDASTEVWDIYIRRLLGSVMAGCVKEARATLQEIEDHPPSRRHFR